MPYIISAFVVVSASFLFQALTSHDWDIAFERSYFQIVAIGVCYLFVKGWSKEKEEK